jgi:hypothetical protein
LNCQFMCWFCRNCNNLICTGSGSNTAVRQDSECK